VADNRSAGNARLSINLSHTSGVRVVTACGEIDLGSAPQLLNALTADDSAAQVTVVDLSGVTFMDSIGINAHAGHLPRTRACPRRQRYLRP
jgi:anti-anti-sigma factor